MALLAIAPVARKGHTVEIVQRPAIAENSVVAGQLRASVDLVDHRPEVDRLRRIARRWPRRAVRRIRVVAEDAHLDLIPIPAVR